MKQGTGRESPAQEQVRAEWASLPPGMRAEIRYDPSTGCLLWCGERNRKRYGKVYSGGATRLVSRVVWAHVHGPIPEGLLVLHHCDNPPCARPSHLFLGTPADNSRDMVEKGRQGGPPFENAAKTHCDRGHEFSPENTYRPPSGGRECRTCKSALDRARPARAR